MGSDSGDDDPAMRKHMDEIMESDGDDGGGGGSSPRPPPSGGGGPDLSHIAISNLRFSPPPEESANGGNAPPPPRPTPQQTLAAYNSMSAEGLLDATNAAYEAATGMSATVLGAPASADMSVPPASQTAKVSEAPPPESDVVVVAKPQSTAERAKFLALESELKSIQHASRMEFHVLTNRLQETEWKYKQARSEASRAVFDRSLLEYEIARSRAREEELVKRLEAVTTGVPWAWQDNQAHQAAQRELQSLHNALQQAQNSNDLWAQKASEFQQEIDKRDAVIAEKEAQLRERDKLISEQAKRLDVTAGELAAANIHRIHAESQIEKLNDKLDDVQALNAVNKQAAMDAEAAKEQAMSLALVNAAAVQSARQAAQAASKESALAPSNDPAFEEQRLLAEEAANSFSEAIAVPKPMEVAPDFSPEDRQFVQASRPFMRGDLPPSELAPPPNEEVDVDLAIPATAYLRVEADGGGVERVPVQRGLGRRRAADVARLRIHAYSDFPKKKTS